MASSRSKRSTRRSSRSRSRSKTDSPQKQRLKTIAKWTALGLLTYETYMVLVDRRQKRRDVFTAALNAKSATKLPMVVIGDPDGSWINRTMGRDSDCEDICIDNAGCPKCPNSITADPHVALEGLADNSHVIFVDSGVFERTKYPSEFLAQLKRVGGANVFISHRQPWSLSAFSPWMKRRVHSAPPTSPYVQWRKLPWGGGEGDTQKFALQGVGRLGSHGAFNAKAFGTGGQ
jgi:hypothetical protein